MKNLWAGVLMVVLAAVLIVVGLHFGHSNPAFLTLIPIGAFCGVGGGFLLAGGRR